MLTLTTLVRTARSDELARVAETYDAWGYRGGVTPSDVVYVAEQGDALLGVVRRTAEFGTHMLRGMHVAPLVRRSGVGSLLLSHFVDMLEPGMECWCVPYTHLQHFYARGGFRVVPVEQAPAFLRERVAWYRQEGLDVVLMRRS